MYDKKYTEQVYQTILIKLLRLQHLAYPLSSLLKVPFFAFLSPLVEVEVYFLSSVKIVGLSHVVGRK